MGGFVNRWFVYTFILQSVAWNLNCPLRKYVPKGRLIHSRKDISLIGWLAYGFEFYLP